MGQSKRLHVVDLTAEYTLSFVHTNFLPRVAGNIAALVKTSALTSK